jgi:acylphosphatase
VRVHILVSGRVQGVGFRFFTAARARSLGVGGSVRNLPDGRVEIVAVGERSALEAFVATVRTGPPGAAVRDARVDWTDDPAKIQEFVIR